MLRHVMDIEALLQLTDVIQMTRQANPGPHFKGFLSQMSGLAISFATSRSRKTAVGFYFAIDRMNSGHEY
jgi:hypothetical protein